MQWNDLPTPVLAQIREEVRHAMQANCCALQMDYDSGLES